MTAEIPNELWRSLFRQAARSQPPPDGDHPAQDEELLTCWSAGQLPDEQHTAVVEHLSQCSPCRRELAELVKAGLLQLPPPPAAPQGDEEPEAVVAAVLRPRRFWRRVRTWGLGLAVAASLLIALALFLLPRGPRAELDRAEQDLQKGQPAAALARLEGLSGAELAPELRERRAHLFEQAAYGVARDELDAGHYNRVAELIGKAADQGIDSGRLANLKLQAEHRQQADTALASAEQEVQKGQPAEALDRLERLGSADLASDQRQRREHLFEQAAYGVARDELDAGHYNRVAELIGKAADQGIDSGRLANLKLQAERKLPSETALASAGTLLAYGYDLGGVNPDKALPVIDEQTKKLLKQWEEAVRRHPQDAKLQENYGQFLLTLGRLEPARRHFEEAARLDARDADARIGLGLVAFQAEEYDGALKQFEEALRLAPDSVAAHLNAAICLEKLQRPADARRHRQWALELTRDAGLRKQIEAFDKADKQKP